MNADPFTHFKLAQADRSSGLASALSEMAQGEKRTHWIWYIFPQIAGLGHSGMARRFALSGLGEARQYLRDGVLRAGLITLTRAVAEKLEEQIPLRLLMGGGIDALKLVSSLTLFDSAVDHELGGKDIACDYRRDLGVLAALFPQILAIADIQGFPRCRFTLDAIRSEADAQPS